MTTNDNTIEVIISDVLEELDALRKRLEGAAEWFKGPEATLRAAALSKDVERLCREAAALEDTFEAKGLLDSARERLIELQKLLGLQ